MEEAEGLVMGRVGSRGHSISRMPVSGVKGGYSR